MRRFAPVTRLLTAAVGSGRLKESGCSRQEYARDAVISKRYDELKPGDVFMLTDDRTYILVAEVLPAGTGVGGTMVRINGYRNADPAKGFTASARATSRPRRS